jgi:Ni/Co efflux regulator RcnB
MKRVVTVVLAAALAVVSVAAPAAAAVTDKHSRGASWGENRNRLLLRRR